MNRMRERLTVAIGRSESTDPPKHRRPRRRGDCPRIHL